MTQILLTDLTSKTLDGTGAFDELMDAVAIRTQSELEKGNILKSDYSTVYLGAMQTVLQQSIAFLLTQEKSGKEADLISAQILKVEQETQNAIRQATVIQNQGLQIAEETLLITSKRALTDAQINSEVLAQTELQTKIDINGAQLLQMAQELILTQDKILTERAQVSLLGSQKLKIDKDIELSSSQLLTMTQERLLVVAKTAATVADTSKSNAEKLLVDANVTKVAQDILQSKAVVLKLTDERSNIVADTALATQNRLNKIQEVAVMSSQITKASSEAALVTQKKFTEAYQTSTLLPAQVALYGRQADGFLRDAEQKAAKIMVDTWAVRQSTDGALVNSSNKLADADIGAVVSALKSGLV